MSTALSEQKIFEKYGVTVAEVEHFNDVSTHFGQSLAEHLHQENRNAYKREFLDDEPVSKPHTYYTIDGELFTQPIQHPLFNIKKNINPAERNGITYQGFEAFESLIVSGRNDVVTWYSPEGDSNLGSAFDSARLYVCFNNGDNKTTHVDIKMRPEFPATRLLNSLYEQASFQIPAFVSQEEAKMFFLSHPIPTGLSMEDFFSYLKHLKEAAVINHDELIYTSKRHQQDRVEHTFYSIIHMLQDELIAHINNTKKRDNHTLLQRQTPTYGHTVREPMTEDRLLSRYLELIRPYVEQNGGQYHLYGCSTTSVVTSEDILGRQYLPLDTIPVSSVISMYSTDFRQLTNYSSLAMDQSMYLHTSTKYLDCTCPMPGCGKKVKARIKNGKIKCPECTTEVDYKC